MKKRIRCVVARVVTLQYKMLVLEYVMHAWQVE
jgi:hypothetical protein